MDARNIIPDPAISAYVDRILVIEHSGFTKPFILPLYANGSPTLLYTSVRGKLDAGPANHLTLFGQTVLPENLTLSEDFILIAYFFKPYSLLPLFGIAGDELTDKPIDLQLISGSASIRTLKEKLLNSKSTSELIVILNEYAGRMIQASRQGSQLLECATKMIVNNYSKDVLAAVQKELCITERSLQRLFHKGLGISPGTFRKICQFNAAFTDLNRYQYNKLSDIAFRHGYADQSHYIRTFKEFTTITPAEYLRF